MTGRQRLLVAIFPTLALIAGAVLWLTNTGGESKASDAIIEARIPSANDKVLQQAEVGIDLISGWDVQITLNGKVIPDDQVKRLTAQSRYSFVPGAGREVETYNAGQNCVLVKYWPLANPGSVFTDSWCFSVL